MRNIITSEILVAYSQCPRKAFLLLCTNTRGTLHEYTKILEQQRQSNQRKCLDILRRKNGDVQLYNLANLEGKHEFLVNATLEANGLVAECAILNKVRTHSALGRYSYEPTIFVNTHRIKKEQKLELFFVSHVLEQVQNKRPVSGRIITLDEKSHKVKLENSPRTLIPFLEPLQEWAADTSPEPPSLILNKHCPTCQFYNLCRTKAKQEDNLSLLNGISTQKAINKYEKKGLFTVKQLSYTFKPRKRKKRTKNPPPVVHKPELQALAIREQKIYLQELPQLTRQAVELFLDIEGIPDRQFYYLIGLLVSENGTIIYFPFWADTAEGEAQMWQQFLNKVNQYPNIPIYHYSSFDLRILTKLTKRYTTDDDSFIDRLVNVNKHIFGKVYFPVYSNRLKEIGGFIGANWTSSEASGLQSLVWRHQWDKIQDVKYKNLLLTYNEEDCQAVKLLVDYLSELNYLAEVDFADNPKHQATEIGEQIHQQFETILKFAHMRYDEKKIRFRLDEIKEEKSKGKPGRSVGYNKRRIATLKPNKVIEVLPRKSCTNPKCKDGALHVSKKLFFSQVIIDLILTKNGIKKTIIKYTGPKAYCPICGRYFIPPELLELNSVYYGRGFKAWLIYQRVAMRLPYNIIAEALKEQFQIKIHDQTIPIYIGEFARYYAKTEEDTIQRLLANPVIHADETPINIKGNNQYVWVFTDGRNVVFKLRDSREAMIVHEFLADYEGILISDFYPGYDSITCKQQKCWAHLIRDLNSDLWSAPFDAEFEIFVVEVRNLIIPIMEAVQKYGLKKRHLNKFKKPVDKFYERIVIDKRYKSELTIKYQNRFIRYRDSLFTFLEQDGVPWHNNIAERTIRHLAIQGKISLYFSEATTNHYLVLLGIRQTCRFQNKSFFKFLFSGETDLEKFEVRKRKQRA